MRIKIISIYLARHILAFRVDDRLSQISHDENLEVPAIQTDFQPSCYKWGVNSLDNSNKIKKIPDQTKNFHQDNFLFNPCPDNVDPDPLSENNFTNLNITQCCYDWLIWLSDMEYTRTKNLPSPIHNYVPDKHGIKYAEQMCDSWGLQESGYLMGNFRGEGRYDECVRYNRKFESRGGSQFYDSRIINLRSSWYDYEYVINGVHIDGTFGGKYCSIFRSKEFSTDKNEREYQGFFGGEQYGICIPSSCSEEDIPILSYGGNISYTGKCVEEAVFGTSEIICLTVVCIVGFFSITISLLSLFDIKKFNAKTTPIALFDGVKNSVNFQTFLDRETRENKDTILSSLDGIKFFSLVAVVFGHTGLHAGTEFVDNFQTMANYDMDLLIRVITTLCVDSFFVVSGLLTGLLTLKKLRQLRTAKNKRRVPEWKFWLMYYLGRWLRLVPTLLFMICLTIGVYPFIGQGPVYNQHASHQAEGCKENWWGNILFINNFYPKKGTEACLGWTWYLSVDWQCAFFAPILMVLFYKKPHLSMGICSILLLINMGITGAIDYIYHYYLYGITVGWFTLTPKQRDFIGLPQKSEYSRVYGTDPYLTTYCRYGAYLVGLMGGFYLYQTRVVGDKKFLQPNFFRKNILKRPRNKKIFKYLSWITIMVALWGVLYMMVPIYRDTSGENLWSVGGTAVFMGFIRPGWAMIILTLVLYCENGMFTPAHTFLGADVWLILNRLGYSAYLLQSLVIYYFYDTMIVQLHVDGLHLVWNCFGCLFMTLILAYFLYILVETPIARLVDRYVK